MNDSISDQFEDAAKPIAMAARIVGWFQIIPYWLIALTCRVALAQVFWSSAQTHLASWQTTLYLFAHDYALPFLPPVAAAYIAVTVEVTVPPLLLLGLATRFAALVLFGMTLVIEIFVYPQAWPTHIQWAAMMLVLMGRGAGLLSLDQWIQHYVARLRRRRERQGSAALVA